jgi:OOP family OmpA-OmpF porin
MLTKNFILQFMGVALISAGSLSVHAEGRYYDPSNVASPSGKTIGYELYRTIGCPGEQLLGKPCPVPKEEPAAPPPPKDSDGDGVTDDKDKCPGTPAGRKVNAEGCELDSDGDGVVDGLDKCPGTPAGRTVNAVGCELDSDGDGVVDGLDKCPGTPAGRKVDANGCEFDTDKDGLVDAVDKCPTIYAKTPDGCPPPLVLEGVFFDNNKATLKPESFPVLDKAAIGMKDWGDVKIEVAGYTDSVDSDEHNMKLSQSRAETVRDYLISKGISADRISAKGYGESSPIADNATEEGRAKNRRVELIQRQ